MALTSVFYDGVVTETDRAKNLAGGPEYGVYGVDDFKVTAHPTIPYAVLVKAGRAHGHGVTDEAAIDQIVNCDTLASGTRWDLIVVRRNWQPALGGPSTLVAITAGATAEIPAARKVGPGVEDDQPLALVKWTGGLSAPEQIIDLRVWATAGGYFAKEDLVRSYLTRIGTRITISATNTNWTLWLGPNDLVAWALDIAPAAKTYAATDWQSGALPISTSPDGNNIKLASITIPDPGFRYHVQVLARFEGGKVNTRWDADVSIAGQPSYVAVASLGNTVAPWYDITGFTINPITGGSTVDLNLRRLSGTESFGLTAYNRAFRVMVIPA